MGINVTAIQNQSKDISVKTSLGPIKIEYYPNRYTPDLFQTASDKLDAGELTALTQTPYIFQEIIKSWDLTEEIKGEDNEAKTVMYPIEVVAISKLPLHLIKEIDDAIGEDVNPTVPSGRRR